MRTWFEKYSKNLLGILIEEAGDLDSEHEIVGQEQRVDMLFRPSLERSAKLSALGALGRIIARGLCVIELYARPPRLPLFRDCLRKQLMLHHGLTLKARRQKKPEPPVPYLVMISVGRPLTLITELEMRPTEEFPGGFWRMPRALRVDLIVVRDLPYTPDTLFLRLMARGRRQREAIAELQRLPSSLWTKHAAMEALLAWRHQIFKTRGEDEMKHFVPEMGAAYEEWAQKVRREGRREGREKGLIDGERALMLRMLAHRFGELPESAARRIKRADPEQLDRWAKRMLDADTLDQVFADPAE